MSSERLLNTVLQRFQTVHDVPTTEQIIGTTTHLLTELGNPRNLEVLTSQLLTAPAIWRQNTSLKTSLRIISIYNTAAVRVAENAQKDVKLVQTEQHKGSGIKPQDWVHAVIKGADDRSKRWQHLLVLTGVLLGMESNERRTLSWSMRNTIGHAVVTAANLALETVGQDGQVAAISLVMALNFVFPLLSDNNQASINCNALLPLAISSIVEQDGFSHGQFLQSIHRDTLENQAGSLTWTPQSPSFKYIQDLDRGPLVGNMGPLSKLAGFAAQHATDSNIILQAQETLVGFSFRVLENWTLNRFSLVEPELESARLSPETLQATWQPLWLFLRKLLFGVVVILQSIVSRSLLDPNLLRERVALGIAAKSLYILRNLFFISNRNGNSAFSVYMYTYLTSIDVLSRNQVASEDFLKLIQQGPSNSPPTGHLRRTLDLYYLNISEHLPLALSTEACDSMIIKPATQYLSLEGRASPSMTELFESAHSAILSVLSCPQHSQLTIKMAPFYIVKLLESFPQQISARQFRIAFKTVMQMVSPPFPIAALEPHLSETLLEMLYSQANGAVTVPLPAMPQAPADKPDGKPAEPLSEQSTLLLALVDSIPYLPLPLVEEWLTVAAKSFNQVTDPRLREPIKARLWEILVNGEMDVERAAIGVAWWGTRGGKELVLFGAQQHAMMSGALVSESEANKL